MPVYLRPLVPGLGVFLAAATAALPVWAQQGAPYHEHHMWGEGWSGMFFGPIVTTLVIAALIAALVFAARWFSPGGRHTAQPPKMALDILNERLARGEIDEEEFRVKKRLLEK